jgi:hypothetical protein
MQTTRRTLAIFALAAAPLACSGADDDKNDPGTDADSDADADADTDTDGDGDTDTEYTGPAIPETCEQAAEAKNSVGCAFFAADLENFAEGYVYAIVVSNPQLASNAHVVVEDMRGDGGTLRTVPGLEATLQPGELRVFEVSCAASQGDCPVVEPGPLQVTLPKVHIEETGKNPRSAFRVVSDVPILAYQWNTYGTQMNTADASLLLPVTALDDEYIGATWPWGHETESPGFERGELTVVAVEDGTQVTFTPAVAVEAAEDSSVPAMSAGAAAAPIALDAFDVVQISPAVLHADLTGTRISANKPIAVFGTHPCANVPEQPWFACDHVEEQLLPLRAWGADAVLARYAPRPDVTAAQDRPVWRVVAGADGMTVSFDPAVEGVGASHHFVKAGDVLQFMSAASHYASAVLDDPPDPGEPGAPFFAYQLMTGRFWVKDAAGLPPLADYEWGDPFMVLAPPAGQYLNRYVFTTDNVFDFAYDRIVVVRKAGYAVTLDCLGQLDDGAFQPVGASEWEVGWFNLDQPGGVEGCEDGAHRIESDAVFGLTVVGEDYALSVGYPGGIGVRWINPVYVE